MNNTATTLLYGDANEFTSSMSFLNSAWSPTLQAGLAGALSHLYFGRGYRDLEAAQLFDSGVVALVTFFSVCIYLFWDQGILAAISYNFCYSLAFFVGLAGSILMYRLFFHRVRRFPGPITARMSKFYMFYHGLGLQQHVHVKKLHEEFGDWVRIGPNEISVIHPDALAVIYGPKTKCSRGPWYGMATGPSEWSLHTTQDKDLHRQRRRVWERAFSTKALDGYMPKVIQHTNVLIDQVARRASKPLRMDELFNYYSFDVMGDVGFGTDFGMLQTCEEHEAITTLHAALRVARPLSAIPWSAKIILRFMHGSTKKFMDWCYERTVEKRNSSETTGDVFSWLLAEEKTGIKMSKGVMQAEGRLIIVAASDTTAATLTNIFYNLAARPEITKQLQEEIDAVVGENSEITNDKMLSIKLLNAVIHESLRMFPAIPSGLERFTPPEGLEIAGVYVPGDVTISVPMWTLHRDPRNFVDPDSFRPERWTTQPELILKNDIFFPFSQGRDSCIGKNLAMVEMCMVVVSLLKRFDFYCESTQQLAEYPHKVQDTFTLMAGDLSLTFVEREIKSRN